MRKIIIVLVLFITTISSAQWYQSDWPVSDPTDFFFKDSLSGILFGNGYCQKTTDGGTTWQGSQSNTMFLDAQIYFFNDSVGISYRYRVNKTTNMGDSWQDITPQGYHEFIDMYFVNDSTGYLVGLNGEIFFTNNQGITWQDISYQKGSSNYLYTVYFSDSTNGWIYGNGFKLKTSDGGKNWSKENAYYDIRYVKFFSSKLGYALTGGGYHILKTTDAGDNWEEINTPPAIREGSMFFINENTGFISGGIIKGNYLHGSIYKTTDGCKTWELIYESNVSSVVYKIFFINGNTGWAISSLGLLRTNSGGITSIKSNPQESQPISCTLLQNYPNPFNPNTTIDFSVAHRTHVRLEVFDLLGRTVKVLVNEELIPGNYKIDFDASNLPSGLYFYRMIANDYMKVKKAILLK